VPLVEINGRTGAGINDLIELIASGAIPLRNPFITESHYKLPTVEEVQNNLGVDSLYGAYLLCCQAGKSSLLSIETFQSTKASADFISLRMEVEDKQERILTIKTLLTGVETKVGEGSRFVQRVDSVLTHKVWGSAIFLAVLFLLFQLVFAWATPMMDAIDGTFAWISQLLSSILPEGIIKNLIVDGIIPGIGGVVIFIPQIAMLFGLVAILEESGYMSRAVFLSDKLMNKAGLNGRSIVSLISGVACAVPAIMATRTIGNHKERLITILVTPFITCSARLPVYLVLIAFIIPAEARWLGFSLQGIVMFGLYMLGALTALLAAYVMSKFIKTKESSFLMLELPAYQPPQVRNVLITVYEKSRVFVVEAGKVILVISVILWALSSYGPSNAMDRAELSVTEDVRAGNLDESHAVDEVAARRLEASYVGHLGKFIEPSIAPLGFDWKMGIALITSFAAREVFVSTMATIYAAGSVDDDARIISRMRKERDRVTGEPIYTPLRSLSLLLFYVFALQCMSTLAIVKRETGSWWITIGQFVGMTAIAYLVSLGVYQFFS
jgi:ferrous iron transport protein B